MLLLVHQVDEATSLLRLAEKYKVSHLIAICEQWLCQETHRMHIGGLQLNPSQPEQFIDPDLEEHKNWSLGKWLQLSEALNMDNLKRKCQCSLTGVFFSKSILKEGLLASIISDLTKTNDVSAKILVEVMSVMGMWVNTLGCSWSCRKCCREDPIPRSNKCATCGQSYQQDCLQFGLVDVSELSPLFTADEEIVLQMFKSIDSERRH